jgi:hypothetical protein
VRFKKANRTVMWHFLSIEWLIECPME